MTTVSDLTTFVRDVVDLDEADLPSSLIRAYMKDGYQRIVNLERRWPFFEVTYTLNTTQSLRDYDIDSIGNGDLREVTSVLDNSTSGNRLSFISVDEAEGVWHGSFDTPSRPLFYAEWGETMKLYPKPDGVYPLTIRGYRRAQYDWVNDPSLEPDCDERLHSALAYYAIAQSYKRQEDTQMFQAYKSSFDEAVALARKDLMRTPGHRPMVLSRGFVRPSEKYWLESLGRTLGQ